MTTYADNFTRANAPTLGTNWSSQTGSSYGIVSNAAVNQGGFSVAADYWSANAVGNAQFSQVTLTTINGSNWAGVMVYAQSGGANSNYAFETNGSSGTGNTYLAKNVSGTQTILHNFATTFANGDVIRLEADGAGNLTCYKNGSSLGSFADATFSSGQPGITGYGGSDVLNSWSGGDLVTNPTLSPSAISYSLTLENITLTGPTSATLNPGAISYSMTLENATLTNAILLVASALVYSMTLVNQTLSSTSNYSFFPSTLSYSYSSGQAGSDLQVDASFLTYGLALQNASLQTPLPVIVCAGGTFDSLTPMPGLML